MHRKRKNKDEAGSKEPFRRSRDQKNRHPSHLKGRDIGLFYAQKNKERNIEANHRPLGTILLSEQRKNDIRNVLDSLSNASSKFVADGKYSYMEDSHFKREFLRVINETIDSKLEKKISPITSDDNLNEIFYNEYISKQKDLKYLQMLEKRQKLPSYDKKDEILNLIEENQVVVLSGETGCGKTTQVAQFILDSYLKKNKGSICRIVCTQPRRISAITVAERVAAERVEKLGNSVGYHIRLERRLPRERGSICFCTTGVVLKLMEDDAALSWVSHLILDEIHERDIMSDFILALFKKILTRRKDLKLILMSATLNAEKFSKYYNNAPHINIPGFTFPVKEYYMEDVLERTKFKFENERERFSVRKKIQEYNDFIGPHIRQLENTKMYSRDVCIQLRNYKSEELNLELVLALLINIIQKEQDQGAILVFLTGYQEISKLHKLLSESRMFPQNKFLIFPLHSMMPTIDQKQIFEPPPCGIRKIIIATNIAETSITIDDVVFVVDCGKIKLTDYNAAKNSESLTPEWVALANANQRKGRAGRVKPGVCFHLYTKARAMLLEQYQKPEILRTRLEDTILTAKMLQLGLIEPFFKELMEAPDTESIHSSINLLKRLNALTPNEKLTPLGYHLAKLPMAPHLGKMILFGAIFSCLDPILNIAATLDFKEPFQLPLGQEKEADRKRIELSNGVKSDHLLYHETLQQYEECGSNHKSFCWNYFLSQHTLRLLVDMKKQFATYLCEMNFIPDTNTKNIDMNRNSYNVSLIKAIVCAALYPNVTITHQLGKPPLIKPEGGRAKLHKKSVLASCRHFETNILVYYRKVFSSSDYIHDGSLVYPLPLVFFGDNFHQYSNNGVNMISINNYFKFKCTESTATYIKELRDRFNWFLELKIAHPGPVIWEQDNEAKLLNVIMELITSEDMQDFELETFDDWD